MSGRDRVFRVLGCRPKMSAKHSVQRDQHTRRAGGNIRGRTGGGCCKPQADMIVKNKVWNRCHRVVDPI